jgi:hypothetical protein
MLDPSIAFFALSFTPTILLVKTIQLDHTIERVDDSEASNSNGFWSDLERNLYEIWEAISVKECRNILIFLLLRGILGPSFDTFRYYFLLDVVEISTF